jgi:phosphoadenosine phosphosulfate reductase
VNAIELDLDATNRRWGGANAQDIVAWGVNTFGPHLVMSSSFGAESAVMLHLVTQVAPEVPVICVDTGYLFPETYQFIEQLTARLRLNVKLYQSPISPARMETLHGRLWEKGIEGLDRYNQMRKVEPMRRALRDLRAQAWAAGLRRQQTRHRAGLRVVERQDGIYKVHPILTWTTRDVHEYLKKHDLPYHPLYEQGYKSIGDVHTTGRVDVTMDARSGRFGGLKQECGLHLPQSAGEEQPVSAKPEPGGPQ